MYFLPIWKWQLFIICVYTERQRETEGDREGAGEVEGEGEEKREKSS